MRGESEYVDQTLLVVNRFDCNLHPGGNIGDIRAEYRAIHLPQIGGEGSYLALIQRRARNDNIVTIT
jgi:hypothetical protein